MDPRISKFRDEIGSAEIHHCYLLCGSEELIVKEATQILVEQALGDGLADFNLQRFDLDESGIEEALDAAATQPMMGRRRVVVVRSTAALDKGAVKRLDEYCEQGSSHATLIVTLPKADARLALVKRLKKARAVFQFDALQRRDVPAWIGSRARELGYGIDSDAARMLQEVVGADLLMLTTTLEKLIAFVGEPRPITRADVEACVARTREEVVWDLTDAVGERDRAKAIRTVHRLLEGGQSPIMITAMVARHLRQLLTAGSLGARRVPQGEIAGSMHVPPFVARKLLQQVRAFDRRMLRSMLERLFETDRALKSSRADPRLLVEELVLDLCNARKSG